MEINLFNIICLSIFIEALVELFFKAAPLQPLRTYLRIHTPSLYSKTQQSHLLDCKYCVSVWIAFIIFILYYLTKPNIILTIILYSCIIHRLSNYLHLMFSIIRDLQFNIRINRGK